MVSNSTGAGNINRRQLQHHDRAGSGNNNHWAAWIRASKGSGSANNNNYNNGTGTNGARVGISNQQQQQRGGSNNNNSNNKQLQLKLAQGERGPQGPKVSWTTNCWLAAAAADRASGSNN